MRNIQGLYIVDIYYNKEIEAIFALYLFYISLSQVDIKLKQCIPGAVVSVLHVGDADGGVADSVVDHRVHRHRHAVLRQHLRTDTDTVPKQLISQVLPPEVALLELQFSGPPSDMTRYRAGRRICL